MNSCSATCPNERMLTTLRRVAARMQQVCASARSCTRHNARHACSSAHNHATSAAHLQKPCISTSHAHCCRFKALLEDAAFALELAQLEDSSSSELAELLSQARSSLQQLAAALDTWELRVLLAGPYDEAGALLTITAGAGAVHVQLHRLEGQLSAFERICQHAEQGALSTCLWHTCCSAQLQLVEAGTVQAGRAGCVTWVPACTRQRLHQLHSYARPAGTFNARV